MQGSGNGIKGDIGARACGKCVLCGRENWCGRLVLIDCTKPKKEAPESTKRRTAAAGQPPSICQKVRRRLERGKTVRPFCRRLIQQPVFIFPASFLISRMYKKGMYQQPSPVLTTIPFNEQQLLAQPTFQPV
ncbi:hypothetical protein V9T40_002931 [Parthenolecanium corni]|uniref:Uncharacterized protein n=1 Tax=Parthenolecanium corni TaxID=536013 RepID=A0AAN9Y635_9HEMI